MTYSKLLKQKGIETSSVKEKLRFCSEAVEAISSVVVESKFKLTKTESITPLLDRDEIDFIHEMMLSENEGESNEGNNQSKMDLYGT